VSHRHFDVLCCVLCSWGKLADDPGSQFLRALPPPVLVFCPALTEEVRSRCVLCAGVLLKNLLSLKSVPENRSDQCGTMGPWVAGRSLPRPLRCFSNTIPFPQVLFCFYASRAASDLRSPSVALRKYQETPTFPHTPAPAHFLVSCISLGRCAVSFSLEPERVPPFFPQTWWFMAGALVIFHGQFDIPPCWLQ